MKAMVLAAGLGTRLGALTENTPKCLIQAGSHTMLEHVAAMLKRAGVSQIVINLHYLAEQVERFVRDHDCLGLDVQFSYEPEILGTGGGLKKAQPYLSGSEPFIVCNSDIYTDADLSELLRKHASRGAIATLAVTSRKESSYLLFGEDERLVGWQKADGRREIAVEDYANPTPLAFCGLQVVSPAIFKFMESSQGAFSIIQTYMQAARAGELITSCSLDGSFWLDMGTPGSLSALRTYFQKPVGQRQP